MNILSHFPGDPRTQQRDVCLASGEYWDQCSVQVIQGPVAVGKSRIAVATARAAAAAGLSTAIITPNNVLVNQYEDEFPELAYMRKLSLYPSKTAFSVARARASAASITVSTYYAYVANRLWKDVLIIDEAHNVLPMLQDRWAERLWQHKYWYPDDIQTLGDALRWMESSGQKKLVKLAKEIVQARSYTLEDAEELYRGEMQRCLKLTPLTVRDKPAWLWAQRKIKRVILMSATINSQDIYEMGLDRRRTVYIEVDSPIPPANRLVYYDPVVDMKYALREHSVDILAAKLRDDLDNLPGKGVIHCSYDVADRLRYKLKHERLIWHTRTNKKQQYRVYRDSPSDSVLIACGFSEGIDLVGDAGRWQIITQLMFPDLNDVAVATKMQDQPEWYIWQVVRTLLQTLGRICRTPTDLGFSKIYDSQFARVYEQYPWLFPQHVRNSIVGAPCP